MGQSLDRFMIVRAGKERDVTIWVCKTNGHRMDMSEALLDMVYDWKSGKKKQRVHARH